LVTVPETERLIMRAWREDDLEPFAALNADPIVMEFFPSTLTRQESDALVTRITAQLDTLAVQTFPAPFNPSVEVGWRLARAAWGHGYATEAAIASLDYGFTVAGLDEIVSMTATTNVRSQRVMQRIGMTRDPADDFEHPNVPDGHRVKPHVLYRIARS
jgi:ribosomal-protein-alanine N-acetyltransferase